MKWNLVTPFLNDSEDFALGVQFGMLYEELKDEPSELNAMVSRKLEDQVLLTAGHLGYRCMKRKLIDKCWITITLRRID